MKKIEVVRHELTKRSLDALVVLDELNQQYLSDFAFTDGFLFITLEKAYLVTDFRYYEMATKHACPDYQIIVPEIRGFSALSELIDQNKSTRIGFEGDYVSYETHSSLCEANPGVTFVSVQNMLKDLRQVKTNDEIEMMQKAQDITDKAFNHILNVITPEMTEIDVAVELEYAMRKNGATGFAFDTISVSGDASALPHGTPRNVKLKKGFLTMDFGAKFNGYCSDMTRTIVIGKADQEIKKLYNTVLDAQSRALEFLRAGVDCGEADKVARDVIDSIFEYKGAFGHSLGHSVGLFIHESPNLSTRSFGKKLVVNNVLTVEPGIYLFGKYGCRIEDMVAIKEDGIYNFTHSPKELIEIL